MCEVLLIKARNKIKIRTIKRHYYCFTIEISKMQRIQKVSKVQWL